MKSIPRIGLALLFFLATGPAVALDKSEPLLCASIKISECVDGAGCRDVLPEDVNIPTFLWIDLKKKEISVSKDAEPTAIERMEDFEGHTLLQGADPGSADFADGGGWTITIEDDTGRMAGTAITRQAAVVFFGTCTEY